MKGKNLEKVSSFTRKPQVFLQNVHHVFLIEVVCVWQILILMNES